MRWVDDPRGEFPKIPWFSWDELEERMEGVLIGAGWPTLKREGIEDFPAIDIESLVTKLGIDPDYRNLPEGVHGQTGPNDDGEIEIFVSSELAAQAQTKPGRVVRLRSTIAHEVGHYYLHKEVIESVAGDFLCRETDIEQGRYDKNTSRSGRDWLEQQANRAMAALLMPRKSLIKVARKAFGLDDIIIIDPAKPGADLMVEALADLFQVSRIFAITRIHSLRYAEREPAVS